MCFEYQDQSPDIARRIDRKPVARVDVGADIVRAGRDLPVRYLHYQDHASVFYSVSAFISPMTLIRVQCPLLKRKKSITQKNRKIPITVTHPVSGGR